MIRWRGDRVVVNPFSHTATKSGIILPKTDDKMRTGQVIGVGSGVKDINVGDVVYFLKWVGNPIRVDGIEAVIFSAYHVIGFPC